MDNEISHAFKNGDYKKASELLQKVRDPNNVDLLGFYPDKYKHIDCHTYKVSLLHLAAYHGWLNICHRLITKYNHDLHVHKVCQSLIDHSKQFKQYSGSLLDISKQGQTLTVLDDVPPPPPPLFYATLGGHYEVVKYLINECNCDPHQKSVEGETPLYLACLAGHYDIVTYLINKCHSDPNTTIEQMIPVPRSSIPFSSNSTTPLYGLLSIVDHILYTPLHIACRYGHLDIVKFLVSVSSVDVNSKDSDGYTPLHTACRYSHLDIVECLLTSTLADVNSKNCNGYTPLHTACNYGCEDIVKFLVSVSAVDVNNKASDGSTPLSAACLDGNLDIIEHMLSLSSVDVNIRVYGNAASLYEACSSGKLNVIKFLLSSSSVNVNIKDDDGYTLLHTACHYGKLDIAKFLVSTEQINPMSANRNGDTPLHIACSCGNADIVKYLLSTGHIDPMVENRQQKTAVQLAENNYDILKLLEPFTQCRVDFPVESYSKVFLCGNTGNGKSSLAHTLCQQVNRMDVSWLEWLNPFKQHEKAEPLTAGIVPHHIQSDEIGNIVLYDFAGHPEYYSSHAAVLENFMLRSPAVFIILIKLTDTLEDIKKQFYYWVSFIQNVSSRVSKKSQVIVVGSHADVKEANKVKNLVENTYLSILKQIKQLEYKGFVAMDCRKQNGTSFDQFITYLSESTQSVVDKSDNINFYCHVLYAFLKTKLVGQVAITSKDLLQKIQDKNEPSLPSNESHLIEFLTILSDKGLILFIKSTDSINSWVIIDKSSLLKEINGTLFAPSHFKEYCSTLASNTGIVQVSVLSDVFPQYDPDMLLEFLKSLEFCHEIDENTLKIIITNFSSSEKLLYFPALVSVEPSSEVTITDGFGWCLWCSNPYQFFTTRFLHVLLLRLAYTFSLKVSGGGIIQSNPTQQFDRFCIVWKNGICWTRDGVKCIVQVSEQNRSVILLVQPNDGMEYCEIRSSVIKKILDVKNDFCICPDTKEFLISPDQLGNALQCNLTDLSLYEVQDVARSIVQKKKYITNDRSKTLNISSLLGQLEPYHSLPLSVIHQLFNDSNVSQLIPEHLLRKIQERCRPIMDTYLVTRESSTYQSVRDHLNRFSIFAGRNPFVSE